mgnify:FL=1|tara:strand:- start:4106 stop:4699 length:594 start_codon:yes stop_codon:yes gene_type:complete
MKEPQPKPLYLKTTLKPIWLGEVAVQVDLGRLYGSAKITEGQLSGTVTAIVNFDETEEVEVLIDEDLVEMAVLQMSKTKGGLDFLYYYFGDGASRCAEFFAYIFGADSDGDMHISMEDQLCLVEDLVSNLNPKARKRLGDLLAGNRSRVPTTTDRVARQLDDKKYVTVTMPARYYVPCPGHTVWNLGKPPQLIVDDI